MGNVHPVVIILVPIWGPLVLIFLLAMLPVLGIYWIGWFLYTTFADDPSEIITWSVTVGKAAKNETPCYRRAGTDEGLTRHIHDHPAGLIFTLDQLWRASVQEYGNRKLFGTREVIKMHLKGTPFEAGQKTSPAAAPPPPPPPPPPQGDDSDVKIQLSDEKKGKEEEKKEEKKGDVKVEIEKKKEVWIPVKASKYKWITYKEADVRVARFAAALRYSEEPIQIKKGEVLSLFMETRPEWMITAHACFRSGVVVSTVYASLGVEALQFSFNETKCSHIITSSNLVGIVLGALAGGQCPSVKVLIWVEDKPPTEQMEKWNKQKGDVLLISYSEMLNRGKDLAAKVDEKKPEAKAKPEKKKDEDYDEEEVTRQIERKTTKGGGRRPTVVEQGDGPSPGDLAVIMYTSGSTGNPKGVMLTHENVISVLAGSMYSFPPTTTDDVYVAYLPLAHIFELMMESGVIARGASMGYSNPAQLSSDSALDEQGRPAGDLFVLRPTIMAAVPLILDRIRGGISDTINRGSVVVRTLFNMAYYFKLGLLKVGSESSFWDFLVFDKIRARTGGRLRLLVTGGAPLSSETHDFMRVVFCPVLQGYGATETSGAVSVSAWDDPSVGHVGGPVASVELKLVSVPDMNYLVEDKDPVTGESTPRGEIWATGANISIGYYKMPEKTETDFPIDEKKQRWFATGDIGVITRTGVLKIIDRKKDLVKLKAGEYIALGALEAVFKLCPYVENICMCANGFVSKPVALIMPSDSLVRWAFLNGISGGRDAICDHPKVIEEVHKALRVVGTQQKVRPWEVPHKIKLCSEKWTPDNGLLTAAMKLKRKNVEDAYKGDVEAMLESCK